MMIWRTISIHKEFFLFARRDTKSTTPTITKRVDDHESDGKKVFFVREKFEIDMKFIWFFVFIFEYLIN